MGPPATSKFQTACAKEMKQSLRCMETGDKDKCADVIEIYKDCRKAEQDRQKAARNPSGGFKWRCGLVQMAAAKPDHHQQQQPPHQKPRRSEAGPNPVKALRRAVAMMNSLLQLVFTTGDMFGHVSSSSSSNGSRAPDLGLRRGGGSGGTSGNDGRSPPPPPPDAPAGGRWRRLRRRRTDGAEPGSGDGDEDGEAAEDGGKFVVSKQDLNSWDTWYGGGWGRRQGVADAAADGQVGANASGHHQRRRKKVTFSTRYSCAVSVANGTRLHDYMTLPFDQYSLLDQAFISRIDGAPNVFRFTVPANELVGLQTVPIVDVEVGVDARQRRLTIASIASRLVSRAADGTVLSTHQVGLLANNSLRFSTKISWAEPLPGAGAGVGGGMGILGGLGRGNGTATGSEARVGGDGGLGLGGQQQQQQQQQQQRNGPGANLARLRRRIFQGGAAQPQPQPQQELWRDGDEGDGGEDASTDVPTGPVDAGPGVDESGGESFRESTRRKLSRASRRRLTCQARVEVGVVVPPPFSLLPGLVLRQGASLILSTLVSTLTNRFLDLLVEDYYRWARDDEESRLAASATGRGLLGWDPEQISDRELSVEAEAEAEAEEGVDDDGDDGDGPREGPLPPPEYMI